jgi:hypothetical protein
VGRHNTEGACTTSCRHCSVHHSSAGQVHVGHNCCEPPTPYPMPTIAPFSVLRPGTAAHPGQHAAGPSCERPIAAATAAMLHQDAHTACHCSHAVLRCLQKTEGAWHSERYSNRGGRHKSAYDWVRINHGTLHRQQSCTTTAAADKRYCHHTCWMHATAAGSDAPTMPV